MNRTLTGLLLAALAAASPACAPRRLPAAAARPAPIAVQTTAAAVRPMPRSLLVTGSLVANRRSEVAANASGRVVRTLVERGDFVRQGAALVKLDAGSAALVAAEARAQLESARAQADQAAAACARNDGLLRQGAVTREEWERSSSQCRVSASSARAATMRVDLARRTLADATVRAPFAGLIGERYVNVGEYVQPPTRVATLVELSPLRLQFTVNEADVGRVHAGETITFEVDAFPGERFSGVVAYIAPALRSSTRDLVVEALVANADRRLRPGMFALGRVPLPDEPAVAVSRRALRREAAGSRVFVVVRGTVEERLVQVGAPLDGYVAILDGLKAGELVVVDPGEQVRDGTPVR